MLKRALVLLALLATPLLAAACGSSPGSGSRAGFTVVAGENFWGSIAAQLAGDRAKVHSIIVNPDTDPHAYEPTAADARSVAGARMVIANGVGYDAWLSKLVAADGTGGQVVLNVGEALGLRAGENPHQWYNPSAVQRVIRAIVADYARLDPVDAAYFARREQTFETRDLASYDALRREIRSRYAGVPVGYSESIFAPLGADLGLRLLTPYSFAKAIAEGTEVTAQDKQLVDTQASRHEIKVWVFNRQNVTPDVQRVSGLARAAGIPIATVTETLSPASATFEQWQSAELRGLLGALRQATGR